MSLHALLEITQSCPKNPGQDHAQDLKMSFYTTCRHTYALEEVKLRIGECDNDSKRKQKFVVYCIYSHVPQFFP